ncbi:MAG TPA: uroporphyrinogen decarboxylase family protein [Candidatus Limiplasma sp.]|nr:uroporphyrinogen decarboxylase family protein [Candidatus Limiplasma sp.]HRX08763.1 uroporphyrinogen decarboxylase family protein [Candidatus Limiplasma sp.]
MRELLKAMTYDYPEIIPVTTSFLPAAWMKYGDELRRLAAQYPDLVKTLPTGMEVSMPQSYHAGSFTDEWGCVWSNIAEGMESIVTGHPVKTREDILTLEIPKNRDGRLPHGFMYLRLLDLRGFEEAMFDFADECDELQILIDKVLQYNMNQIVAKLPTMDEVAYFGDDLGMQKGLAIGPEKWRKYLKPAFMKMYQYVRKSGRYVYMHTDGMIYEIMPDLQECGVNMINPQYRANGLDNLVRVCKGKIPINLDLDRQLFPFATPSEIDSHVAECVEALYLPQGGLSLNVELNHEVPLENMAAVLDAVRKYRTYKG